ncbi:MBL fold metallo-hydrolase [Halopiger goleimassiliensis]|uniref:MBL fold metallo-hydrolase n=1 Tax=Halopiger goleimassiliensis TaxID=1293048 RepID=UPI000677FE89|nr:MBL fold metallo-hydrolase [Halopiger goleimassiliensis]
MTRIDHVYQLPVTLEPEDQDIVLHPAAVETDRGLLLLDAGCPGIADQLEEHLTEAGFDWDDVWGVVLTHQDVDHAGGLAAVIDRADPVVFAHPDCAPYVDGRKHPVKIDDDQERYPAAPVHVEIPEGTTFETAAGPMDVFFTPGHAPGHVSLYFEDADFLVSGDALHAPEGDLDGPRWPRDEQRAVESIEALSTLEFERTLCYHGGFVQQGTTALDRICRENAAD